MDEKEMRPIVVSTSGKVEGIRGLFKDERTGRFFVRKTIKTADGRTLDRQKTVQVNTNLTFSGLERLALKALKDLEKEMRPVLETLPTPSAKQPKSPVEAGQAQLKKFLESEKGKYSAKTWAEKAKRCEGFALVTRSLLKSEEVISSHNKNLLLEKLEKYEGRNEATEIFKDLSSVFNSALKAGVHVGVNPTSLVKKPCDVLKKDFKYITIKQMGLIINLINIDFEYNIAKVSKEYTKQELLLYFYLLCIGMRASSAILFKAQDIEQVKVNGKYKYYYRVYNNKRSKKMPYKQLISKHIINDLKQIHAFTYSIKTLQNTINKFMKHCYPDSGLCCKHLRKTFINEAVEKGGFDLQTVGLITHLSPMEAGQNVTVIKNYYSRGQLPCDKIMSWFNRTLFNSIMNTNNHHKEHFIVNNIKLQNIMLKRKLKKMGDKK